MNTEAIKADNEATILQMGAEVCSHLPLIDSLSEVTPQPAEAIARRICALSYVIPVAYDVPPGELWRFIQSYGLEDGVSRREREALTTGQISKQFKIDCDWLTESVQALMWCLGRAEMAPGRHCDDDLSDRVPVKIDPSEFIATATARPLEEIASRVDLYYRLHWYTRHCKLTKQECVLSDGIVMERRKALDWVYGVEADWDEIPLDT